MNTDPIDAVTTACVRTTKVDLTVNVKLLEILKPVLPENASVSADGI